MNRRNRGVKGLATKEVCLLNWKKRLMGSNCSWQVPENFPWLLFLRRNLSIGKKGAPHITTILSFFSTLCATYCTVQCGIHGKWNLGLSKCLLRNRSINVRMLSRTIVQNEAKYKKINLLYTSWPNKFLSIGTQTI